MDPLLTAGAIDDQLAKMKDLGGLVATYGWQISREKHILTVWMAPVRHVEKKFRVRMACDDYPERAPSLQFVELQTGKTGSEFWPQQGSAFQSAISRDGNLPQLCIRGIREFHDGCHRGDAERPWRPEIYPFSWVLEQLQILLDEAYP